MQTIRYELIPAQGTDGEVAVITFDETNSPVNTMCRQWQQELGEVTAGDEFRLGRRDDHALDRRVVDGAPHGGRIGRHRGRVEDVHRRVAHPPGQCGDAVGTRLVVDAHGEDS